MNKVCEEIKKQFLLITPLFHDSYFYKSNGFTILFEKQLEKTRLRSLVDSMY
ncbi:hypothetical protein RV13_GL001669 [Enterococcus raffinosus]|nr:hypothetical protein RV13_GL001669 [Enterococcus raffinosus]